MNLVFQCLYTVKFTASYHIAGRAHTKQSKRTQTPEKHPAKDLSSINKQQQRADIQYISMKFNTQYSYNTLLQCNIIPVVPHYGSTGIISGINS